MRAWRGLLVATALLAASAAHDVATAGDAPRAVADIETDLVADDPALRATAAAELADRFPDGAVAVPMLVDLLDDESPEVVAAAAKAIDSMAVDGAAALAAHYARHPNSGPSVILDGNEADGAFERWASGDVAGAAFDLWIWTFDSWPHWLSTRTPWLLRLAHDERAPKAAGAAAALAVRGADRLVDLRVAPPAHPRRAAAAFSALALMKADGAARDVGELLLERVRSSDPAVVAALLERVAGNVNAHQACGALAALGPRVASAAPALVVALAREDTSSSAALALVAIGREADAVAAFARAEGASKATLAESLAFRRVGGAVVVPYLTARVEDPQLRVVLRLEAASSLARYGDSASAALPALRKLADTVKAREGRITCADAVLSIAPSDAAALAIVEDSLSDQPARNCALRVYADHAPPSDAAVARLREAVVAFSTSPATDLGLRADVAARLVNGLARFGPAARAAAPDLAVLVGRLAKGCADVETMTSCCPLRARVARALGRIGADAAPAVPELEALTKSADETIRVPAAQALRRIRAKKG